MRVRHSTCDEPLHLLEVSEIEVGQGIRIATDPVYVVRWVVHVLYWPQRPLALHPLSGYFQVSIRSFTWRRPGG